MISITTIIMKIQAVRTSLFLYNFSPWRHKKRDTNVKAYANHTILTPLPHTANLGVTKISTYICRSRPKLICFNQIRKTQPRASTVEPQLPVFSKFSNSQDHLFRYDVKPLNSLQRPTSPIFCLGAYYDR